MRKQFLFTTNKHGKNIAMPPTCNTGHECLIMKILDDFGVRYEPEYRFDKTGQRSYPFDIAVFKKSGELAFLVEYDGESHYSPEFYEQMGNRKGRNLMHVIKAQFATVKKAQIALEHGVPLLRLDALYDKCIRYILMVWVWALVDGCEEENREISSVMMMDKYGWDFEYVPQYEPGKKVQAFLDAREEEKTRQPYLFGNL